MNWATNSASVVIRWVATVIAGSATAATGVEVATLSLAEAILDLLGAHLAEDIGSFKDHLLRERKAKADLACADAKKRLAEAAAESNAANLHKRKDVEAQLHRQAMALKNAKLQVEIDSIRTDNEIKQMAAKARLIDAVSRLKQEGGAVFFDASELEKMIKSLSKVEKIPMD